MQPRMQLADMAVTNRILIMQYIVAWTSVQFSKQQVYREKFTL